MPKTNVLDTMHGLNFCPAHAETITVLVACMTRFSQDFANGLQNVLVCDLFVERLQIIALQQIRCWSDPLNRCTSWQTDAAHSFSSLVLLLLQLKVHLPVYPTWIDRGIPAALLVLQIVKVCLEHLFVCLRRACLPTTINFVLPDITKTRNALVTLVHLCFQGS